MSIEAAMIRLGLGIAAIAALVSARPATLEAGDAEAPARVRRAIAYLDARQDAWSQFASARRGKGAEATTCVSCHTGVSFALARHALERFVGGTGPTPPEEKTLAGVELRRGHWAELDSPQYRLMYDFDDRKKVESRGTEAVLQALLLAGDDAARGRTAPGQATRDALRRLWETQAKAGADAGSWDWLNFGLQPWEGEGSRLFGASLAALAVASAPGYPGGPLDDGGSRGVESLRAYLRAGFPRASLYNRLWVLLASIELKGVLSPEQEREAVDTLLAARREDGGWALADLGDYQRVDGSEQSRESDGHATGLVLHALRRAGVAADRPEMLGGLHWLRSNQAPDGSWPGISVNKKRDPSTFIGKLMTDAATAYAALAIAEAESP